ncbi:MAG: OmpA family protein [Myxococcota bacterium]
MIAATWALVACSPTYPKCDTDSHCADKGEVCVSGQCQQCRDDSSCGEGQQCNGGRCEAKPECSKNADCQGNLVCKSGACKQECAAAADCGDGMKCLANRCVDQLACNGDADCSGGMECVNARCSEPVNASSSLCVYPTVQFAFNRWALTADAQSKLEGVAACLKEKAGTLTIEGHADERGTEEYNLALGERRARAVRDYLRRLGVASNKLEVISKGELEPVNPASNETAWSENRRADFIEGQ